MVSPKANIAESQEHNSKGGNHLRKEEERGEDLVATP